MKTLLITILALGVAPHVHAAQQLPAGLRCEAETKNDIVRSFEIYDLNTERPGTNIDASIEGPVEMGVTVTSFNGNNGCDNNYDWVFFSDDLTALAQGKVKSIPGMMKFANADSICGDEACEQTETARVSCQLL